MDLHTILHDPYLSTRATKAVEDSIEFYEKSNQHDAAREFASDALTAFEKAEAELTILDNLYLASLD